MKKMKKKLANIGLAVIFGFSIFAAIIGIASAEITTYNKTGKYIEGINVSVNTSVAFNRSCINVPLRFQINNTLNATATTFNVTNQTGLTTNATGTLFDNEWFWVNATTEGTYRVNVSNSENQSEYVNFTVEYSSPSSEITIRIEPETLNLASKGVFTAFITLPEGYNVADINISTVECEGAPAVRGMVSEEDTDNGTFIAKFNRQDLKNVTEGDAVELTVTGELYDGTQFEGNDTIRVIERGKGASPGLLPDRRFYGVKRWFERVHMFFTFDAAAKARLHTHFSEARLAEAKAMIQLGKPEWTEGLMEDYMKELNETHRCMQRQRQKGRPIMDLAEHMCNATDEHAVILSDLVDKVPEQAKPHIEHAINASSRGHIRALEEIEEEKPERAAQLSAEFAEKRMIRAREMFGVGRPEHAQRMLQRYNESMKEAEKAMKMAEKRGLNVTELAEHLGNMTYKHVEVLENLLEKVPEPAKPHIEHAINVSTHGHETCVNRTQMRIGRVIGDIRKTTCKSDADCINLSCPQVIGSDTPICKDGKCWCGGKWQLNVTEWQERFNKTPTNITQKGL